MLVFYGIGDQVFYMDGLFDFVVQFYIFDKVFKVFKGGYYEFFNDCDCEEVLVFIFDWLWECCLVKDFGNEQMQYNLGCFVWLWQWWQGIWGSV